MYWSATWNSEFMNILTHLTNSSKVIYPLYTTQVQPWYRSNTDAHQKLFFKNNYYPSGAFQWVCIKRKLVSTAYITMVPLNHLYPSLLQWASSSQWIPTKRDPDSSRCSPGLCLSSIAGVRGRWECLAWGPEKENERWPISKLCNKLGKDHGFIATMISKLFP